MHARTHIRINAQLPGEPVQFSVNGKDINQTICNQNKKMTTRKLHQETALRGSAQLIHMLLNGIHTAVMSRITSGCRKDNVAHYQYLHTLWAIKTWQKTSQ